MSDKLFIKGLTVKTIIGVTEEERQTRTLLHIDFSCNIQTEVAGITDDIDDAVNYYDVYMMIKQITEKSEFHLLEALGEHIIKSLKEKFPIQKIKLKISKPELLDDTQEIGIEIKR